MICAISGLQPTRNYEEYLLRCFFVQNVFFRMIVNVVAVLFLVFQGSGSSP